MTLETAGTQVLLTEAEHQAVVALRRDLHATPELAFEEYRTAGIVAQRLQAAGLHVEEGVGTPTAVVGTLRGTGSTAGAERTVLLRADMDALPIAEATGLPFASTCEGKMHACGHDGHTAIMITVAERLAARRAEFGGTLRFVFQPAEEIASGAAPMLAAGVVRDVDAVIGLHLWSPLDSGVAAMSAGPVFAGASAFTLTVIGRGGHGAMPHTTVDPVLAAADVISAVQRIVSREVAPRDPAVVTFGSIHGGTASNIIPNEVVLRGTVRTFDHALHKHILRRLEDIARSTAAAAGAAITFEHTPFLPPVVNDAAVTAVVRAVATEVLGPACVLAQEPTMGGDDVGLFLQAAPGCYFLVGAAPRDRTPRPHHHPEFEVAEESFAVGVRVLEESALRLLTSSPPRA